MTRFCGRCGSMLDATAWSAGRCPHCGAEIETSGSEPGSGADPVADTATRPSITPDSGAGADMLATAGMPFSRASTTPAQPLTASIPVNADGRRDVSSSRHAPSPWMLALIAVLVVALVGVSVYALTSPRGISIILAPFTASGASASSSSSSSASSSGGGGTGGASAQGNATRVTNSGGSAAPTTAASPVGTGTIGPSPSGTATVSPTAVPVGTGTVVPMATATATPAQAVLSVTPKNVTVVNCLLLGGGQTTLAVANTGGQPLNWSAASNPTSFALSATSGTLDADQSTSVTVSHITGAIGSTGSVTFSAPGAQGSPQKVTITCVV